MEINKNTIGFSGSNSSNEDLSQYTDADDSASAPTEILAEFLSAIMSKDYPSALKLCKIILQYEPDHETAKQFYPLIQEKILLQGNEKLKLIHDIEESNSEDESRLSDENKNIADCSTDSLSSLSHDQTDVDETTASYSSLEDEVIESNIIPLKNESLSDTEIILKSKMTRILDDNCNIPSSTTTSDSDSFPETKKVSDKLKSFLPYKKNYISMKNFLK